MNAEELSQIACVDLNGVLDVPGRAPITSYLPIIMIAVGGLPMRAAAYSKMAGSGL